MASDECHHKYKLQIQNTTLAIHIHTAAAVVVVVLYGIVWNGMVLHCFSGYIALYLFALSPPCLAPWWWSVVQNNLWGLKSHRKRNQRPTLCSPHKMIQEGYFPMHSIDKIGWDVLIFIQCPMFSVQCSTIYCPCVHYSRRVGGYFKVECDNVNVSIIFGGRPATSSYHLAGFNPMHSPMHVRNQCVFSWAKPSWIDKYIMMK